MSTNPLVVKSYYDVNLACGPLLGFFLSTKLCNMLGDELGPPISVHSILKIRVIDAGWCFLEPKHFTALFQLLLPLTTQTFSVSV